jgi:hypothetical protein
LILQEHIVAEVSRKQGELLNSAARKIAELNIRRYQRLLTERFDALQRQSIMTLLAEEETKLKELTRQPRINAEPGGAAQNIEIDARSSVLHGLFGHSHTARLLKESLGDAREKGSQA